MTIEGLATLMSIMISLFAFDLALWLKVRRIGPQSRKQRPATVSPAGGATASNRWMR